MTLTDKGQLIRLPVRVAENQKKFEQIRKRFTEIKGREPTIDELVTTSGLTENTVKALHQATREVLSLNLLAEDSDFDIVDEDMEALEIVSYRSLKVEVARALETLSYREAQVIRLRYGIDDDTERTLEEVGKIFGVTRERIRQIEAKALRRLRHPSRSIRLKDFIAWSREMGEK